MDPAPLLGSSIGHNLIRSRRVVRRTPFSLRRAARILRRASGRRMMLRESSVQVRENAAEELEQRQSGWVHSKAIILLDVLWNFAFVVSGIAVLGLSHENPSVPLRLWVVGYIVQCLFHIACVFAEHMWQRRPVAEAEAFESSWAWESGGNWSSSSGSDVEYATEQSEADDDSSIPKHLESANTMFSFAWWAVGFYWVTAGGESLTRDSPQLYWLCITFLAFDMVFVILCVAIACLVGIAVCCFLPCIIAILYVVSDQEGATEEEIDNLPKFIFRVMSDSEKVNGENKESIQGVMVECNTNSPTERRLSQEDAECCICLSPYDNEAEVRELPCRHHFHCSCIDKWLHINAICPLCKFNILNPNNDV
ncbi:E3 ubiquitin-protein ligase At4g11680-like [Humulus lupulus]|uniref:E3 ubiquitin-protein ligase At4g11680-like n=1 Tax=Humulus lupulus TaxID=3486 RepID=UPI002B40AE3F|nr:E3 ubiquitin-protein ligase At4g11680-like [Humulus lupulus]